jgi:hypothetical protein
MSAAWLIAEPKQVAADRDDASSGSIHSQLSMASQTIRGRVDHGDPLLALPRCRFPCGPYGIEEWHRSERGSNVLGVGKQRRDLGVIRMVRSE